eukprot:s1878_g25.t1
MVYFHVHFAVILHFIFALGFVTGESYGDHIYLEKERKETASSCETDLAHHSSDPAFVQRISFASEQVKMAAHNAAWWCTWRRRDVKAAFNHCGFCGASWQDCQQRVAPRQQQHQPKSPRRQRQAEHWTYSGQWTYQDGGHHTNSAPGAPAASPRRKKSPRRRRSKSGPEKNSQYRPPPQEPAWNFDQDEVPLSSGPATSSNTAAEHQLQELVQAVKQMDQPLSSDVHQALVKAQKIVTVDPGKQLESAASRLRTARKQLIQAREARQKMHKSWAKFIAEAVQRWNQHSEDFETRDAEHQSAIQAAQEKYQEAKKILESSKEAINACDNASDDVVEINDDELMSETQPSIQEDLHTMVQSFDKIRARQAEVLDGQISKKPRTETPDGDKPSRGSAMLPFGRGGVLT